MSESGPAQICVTELDLGDLLALIHGDGGHYVARHGWAKAIVDARERWVAQRIDKDDLVYAIESLNEACRHLRDTSTFYGNDLDQDFFARVEGFLESKGFRQ